MKKSWITAVLFGAALWGAAGMQGAEVCTGVTGNLAANCGFESGDFSGWTLGGNLSPVLSDQGVDAADAWSGSFGAYVHAATAATTLSQTIATGRGDTYTVTFWLANGAPADPGAGYTNAVKASFGVGQYQSTNDDVFGYTAVSFLAKASGASSTLLFSLQNDAGYYSLDSVSVVLTNVAPEPASLLLVGPALGCFWLSRRKRRP